MSKQTSHGTGKKPEPAPDTPKPGRDRSAQRNPPENPMWRRLAVSAPPAFLQAKLSIGAANDRYEREADRVADRVMRMPSPAIQPKPT